MQKLLLQREYLQLPIRKCSVQRDFQMLSWLHSRKSQLGSFLKGAVTLKCRCKNSWVPHKTTRSLTVPFWLKKTKMQRMGLQTSHLLSTKVPPAINPWLHQTTIISNKNSLRTTMTNSLLEMRDHQPKLSITNASKKWQQWQLFLQKQL